MEISRISPQKWEYLWTSRILSTSGWLFSQVSRMLLWVLQPIEGYWSCTWSPLWFFWVGNGQFNFTSTKFIALVPGVLGATLMLDRWFSSCNGLLFLIKIFACCKDTRSYPQRFFEVGFGQVVGSHMKLRWGIFSCRWTVRACHRNP